ncbi:MAG TPA: hypothetical protein PLZ27_01535, partial [Bacillota bacterium]|nr:hypothetical protein [Bacillota bacterium]
MKKKTIIGLIVTGVIVIFAVAILFDCFYTVAENEFACVFRFSKMIDITDEAGLHFKAPFVDEVRSFPDTVMLYN